MLMSDYVLRIISANPYHSISGQNTQQIVDALKMKIKADNMELKIYDAPMFIDCGSDLEKITCPICGKTIDFDWWGEAMDRAWDDRFTNLSVDLPCCGGRSTLNDLQYYFLCGFSCFELAILNPVDELNKESLSYVQELLGTPIRCIYAHI